MNPLKHLRLLVLTLVLACAALPALAGWVVAQVSQPARYAADGRSWRPLAVGMAVPNHAWIHTGRTGRLLLRSPGETIQFKPNTVAAVSQNRESGRDVTKILHKFGRILIDVEPGHGRTHMVEAPFLAAVVKGTRFEFSVDHRSARVAVREGVVTATHPTLGLQADVRPGQVAIAQGHERFAVRGGGDTPRFVQVAPRTPVVGAALAARSSGGLSSGRRAAREKGGAERLQEALERQAQEEIRAYRERERDGRRPARDEDSRDEDLHRGGNGGRGKGRGGGDTDKGGGDVTPAEEPPPEVDETPPEPANELPDEPLEEEPPRTEEAPPAEPSGE